MIHFSSVSFTLVFLSSLSNLVGGPYITCPPPNVSLHRHIAFPVLEKKEKTAQLIIFLPFIFRVFSSTALAILSGSCVTSPAKILPPNLSFSSSAIKKLEEKSPDDNFSSPQILRLIYHFSYPVNKTYKNAAYLIFPFLLVSW